MSGPQGLKQTPWDNPPVPTPGGSGEIGIGGGLDSDPGPQGIQQMPWTDAPVPVPGMAATSGDADLPHAPLFSTLSDNIAPGTSFDTGQAGITQSRNTVDKR